MIRPRHAAHLFCYSLNPSLPPPAFTSHQLHWPLWLLEDSRHSVTSEPLRWLFPLPGMLLPQILLSSPPSLFFGLCSAVSFSICPTLMAVLKIVTHSPHSTWGGPDPLNLLYIFLFPQYHLYHYKSCSCIIFIVWLLSLDQNTLE